MKTSFSSLRRIALFTLFTITTSGCATQNSALTQGELSKHYHQAIQDAAITEPSEVSKKLVAIIPSNNKLVWKNKDDAQNAKVLVVTWTNYNGYDDKIGQSLTLSREVWVTTVPEVKEFAARINNDKELRLEQLLGLPPKSGKTKFVEMWVKPSSLFRPSADPEITDSEAEITFRNTNKYIQLSDEYVKWYNDLKVKSYGNDGYPWTRLGYTYDWGKNNRNHVGLSEFVIIPGSEVEIYKISKTIEY